jgi:acetyl/propionyl-CoA carboxylase alpha subunit
VRTNAAFLARTLRHPDFRAGRVDTGFIGAHGDALCAPAPISDAVAFGAVIVALRAMLARSGAADPWQLGDGWRLNAPSRTSASFEIDGARFDATAEREGLYSLVVRTREGARSVGIAAIDANPESGALDLLLDSVSREVGYAAAPEALVLFVDGEAIELKAPRVGAGAAEAEAGDAILAPMPGRVLEVRAKAGDVLEAGSVVLVLEAMKMEHALRMPRAGVLASVSVKSGDQVAHGASLATLQASQA